MSESHVLEVAVFTVKPSHIAQMPALRQGLRLALRDFPGLIEFHGYSPVNERTFADIAKWRSLADAEAAAEAFANGDPRFAPYMAAIESLSFMGHFRAEVS